MSDNAKKIEEFKQILQTRTLEKAKAEERLKGLEDQLTELGKKLEAVGVKDKTELKARIEELNTYIEAEIEKCNIALK